jgi:hypothetical protein
MRSNAVAIAFFQLLLTTNSASGQKDVVPDSTGTRVPAVALIVPVGIAISAIADPEVREWTLQRQSRSLDRIAKVVNPLGTARLLVPSMAVTYAAALMTSRRTLAEETLTTAAGYVAADLVESAVKPLIGRERPDVEGNSHRFHPFTTRGDWHSFPSAHVTHITAIARAISMQTSSMKLSVFCGTIVTLVGMDRVYEDQHWTSDVAASIALSSMVSGATISWIARRYEQHSITSQSATSATATSPAPK